MAASSRPVARLAWITLIANLFVIVWGAWVRASGSGAGCGNHWPTCNGVVIPESPSMHTLVEFVHRASSGGALLLVILLVVMAWRAFPAGHRTRKAALASLILICVEAGIGAGLVKFELVAANATLARAISLGIHLVNTQFLLSAILMTAWWAGGAAPFDQERLRHYRSRFAGAFAGLILVGMAGAAASLGDTLFPARTLAEGMAQDRNPALSFLLHIRVWHPVLAITVGTGIIWLAVSVMHREDAAAAQRAATRVIAAVGLQWCLGLAALLLLVPVALQLLHLLAADLVWLSVVWLWATVGSGEL
jgi:cytochrome c oxidase assembly protein subunit 15